MEIPSEVLYIIEELNSNGHEAYVVGGCVRDHLMAIPPKDYDVTTSATPELVKQYFRRTYDTGIKHGTVTVVMDEKQIEVTTFRLDGEYLDFRHPHNVKFMEDIKEDLSRRDFTMNAIAYHMTTGFVDPFDGIGDIKNKMIRGVGEPALRFQEDALRMLRALRFSAQLNFEIEDKTLCALRENMKLISRISAERVRDELCKLLLSGHPEKFATVAVLGMMPYIYDKSGYFQKKAFDTFRFLPECEAELISRIALILRFMTPEEAEEFLRYLKFDNKTTRAVVLLVKTFFREKGFFEIPGEYENLRYEIKKRLHDYGVEPFQKALYLEKIYNAEKSQWLDCLLFTVGDIVDRKECFTLSSLKINGKKLGTLGVEPGRAIGLELARLLDEVMRKPELNELIKLKDIVGKGINTRSGSS